jgi:CubicO group peptidase (beta-lactamase class C family)
MILVMFSATLLMLFSNLGQAGEAPDVTNPEVVEALVDGVLKPAMAKAHSPSGVVVVMKGGKIIFAKVYGYIDVEKGIPVNPETNVFRTGSISGDEI